MARTNGEDQWRNQMEKPNGENKWRKQMEKTNGENKWRKRMKKKKKKKTSGLENEKFIGTIINKIQKNENHPSGDDRHPSAIDSHPNLMFMVKSLSSPWAVIHPVMIAIQINVHGQESIESVIPKTLNTFIESQSNLQCDIRQQYKSAVLRNHWSQIE
ncbi:hypothetical protein BLOT_014585 [Blomia tropicalis]|nr:hypothetical protein BLOT_014585 [Blomia tropicalis]